MSRNELAIKFPIDPFDKVVEEVGEVLQAIGKYKRFGPKEWSPFDDKQRPNWLALVEELNDAVHAMDALSSHIQDEDG